MKAMACLNDGALQLFPPVSGFLQGNNRGLAIKIDYVEADAGSQADVGRRGFTLERGAKGKTWMPADA